MAPKRAKAKPTTPKTPKTVEAPKKKAKAKAKGKRDDETIPTLSTEEKARYTEQWQRFGVMKSSDQQDSLELHCVLYCILALISLSHFGDGTIGVGVGK